MYVSISTSQLFEKDISLIIREIQMKTAMSYQLTSVRMAIIKKSTNNKCWETMWRKRNTYALLVGV